MAKKGQGLPLELIVLAAIAAIVLVLIIAFTIGGGSVFFQKIFKGGTSAIGDDLATARNSCNSLCSQAKLATTTSAWSSSSYCKDTFDIDLDKDGDLGGCDISSGSPGNPLEDEICTGGTYNKVGQMEVDLTCYNSDIDVSCSTTIGGDPASEATC
ncbi:MAG: hypothetical protein J4445_00505 [DPANN group archaeon]|nr:hypothetical protein [DPANN group archaeon]